MLRVIDSGDASHRVANQWSDAMQTEPIPRQRLSMPRRVAAAAVQDVAVTVDAAPAASAMAHIDSMALLRGGKCVQIEHNGSMYKLQATKLGKLILTK